MTTRPIHLPADLLAGRSALITGGASGIGKAICQALAASGAQVCVADLNGTAARAVAAELGSAHRAVVCDVTQSDSVQRAVDQTVAHFGKLDILCANAGISTMNRVADLTEAEWDANLDVNAKGVFFSNQAAIRLWLAANHPGIIVNTASVGGKAGAPFLAHYCASKFAVIGFTQSLAKEVARNGIRVNCVCPGYVRTSMQEREINWEGTLRGMTPQAVLDEYIAMTPMGRLEEADDVARSVLFLASDLAGFITGEALNVSGGAFMD